MREYWPDPSEVSCSLANPSTPSKSPLYQSAPAGGVGVGVGVGVPLPASARTNQLPNKPKDSIGATGSSLSFRLLMLPPPGTLSPATKLRLNRGLLSSKAAGNCPPA